MRPDLCRVESKGDESTCEDAELHADCASCGQGRGHRARPGGCAVAGRPRVRDRWAELRRESGEELSGVYSDIGSQVGFTTQRKEVTATLTGLGLLAAVAAAVTSLLWSARFP